MSHKGPTHQDIAGDRAIETILLPEDVWQRGAFDREVARHGSALKALVTSLRKIAKTLPEDNDLTKMLVIFSNEVAKAGAEIGKSRDAQRVPSGFVLVPLEATRGMINAAIDRPNVPDEDMYMGIYRAMVRAAVAEPEHVCSSDRQLSQDASHSEKKHRKTRPRNQRSRS